jgi:hypothetical protein
MPNLRPFILAVPILLAACSSGHSPLLTEPLRHGADQAAPATTALPPPARAGTYDASIAPDNEQKGLTVGGIVPGTGGQKAQKEKELKEESALEAQHARELQEQAHQVNSDEKTTAQ